jgi:hypothetical protein
MTTQARMTTAVWILLAPIGFTDKPPVGRCGLHSEQSLRNIDQSLFVSTNLDPIGLHVIQEARM